MTTATVLDAVVSFDVARYVHAVRETGRDRLDSALRERMAELYTDLQRLLSREPEAVTATLRPTVRFAELVLQSEWRLAHPGDPLGEVDWLRGLPIDVPGKRYLAYANLRVLNTALGTRWHRSDHAVERQCLDAIDQLVDSWLNYELRTRDGVERWCSDEITAPRGLDDRIGRLQELRRHPVPPPPAQPPRRWTGYLGRDGRPAVLEYLVNLPQSTMHEENAFLRIIHLIEATTWAMLGRVIAATHWLRTGGWVQAGVCLSRASSFADAQLAYLMVLRRTMSIEHFLGFRESTGDASAVQTLSGQLLHIHLIGAHPRKIEALSAVPENTYLLLYYDPAFVPLRRALHLVPPGSAGDVFPAAKRLDDTLFRWRRVHLGLAHRYLPDQADGTGGTSGAGYLQAFYADRLFDGDGALVPHREPPPLPSLPPHTRSRPPLSPLN